MKRTAYVTGMFLGMVAVGFAAWAVMQYGEYPWLYDRVIPTPGVKREQWVDGFKEWATIGIAGSLFASLLWYGLERFLFRFNRWNKNYLIVWFLLMLIPVGFIVLSCLFTKQAQEGSGNAAYIFYIANNLLTYYLGTSLFSPPSVMFTPLGAKYLRWW